MSNPTIVLVPGAWHTPDMYQPLTDELAAAGFSVVGVSLPSVGRLPAKPIDSWRPDADAIRAAIDAAAARGEKVVLLMHSYGAVPGTQAVTGAEDTVRQLVFLAAFPLPAGTALYTDSHRTDPDYVPWNFDKDGWLHATNGIAHVAQDVAPVKQQWLLERIQLHATAAQQAPVESDDWYPIPSTYIICENDKAAPPAAQATLAAQPGINWTAGSPLKLPTGHSPWLVDAALTAAVVREAIGQVPA